MDQRSRQGYLYGLAAYGCWGLVPLYFRQLQAVRPMEVLAHRVVWSLVFLVLLIAIWRRWDRVADCFRQPRRLLLLLATSVLIAINWYVYIRSVELEKVTYSSLGYFITPLVSVLLGMIFLRERLNRLQTLATLLALVGVAGLALAVEDVRWIVISLSLAFSFSFYSLLRKQLPVDGVVGLAMETIFLAPVALFFLAGWAQDGTLALGSGWRLDLLLAASGIVTTVPLICFGQAAQRLPLSTLGFLQYLSPSVQLVLAVLVFGEPFGVERLKWFLLIWAALAVFSVDSYRQMRRYRA